MSLYIYSFQNSKLMKLMERIRLLEEKLEDASNKNAKVKVKQSGNEKLFEGIESNVCLTKTLCSQVSEALQQLNAQVQEGMSSIVCSLHK